LSSIKTKNNKTPTKYTKLAAISNATSAARRYNLCTYMYILYVYFFLFFFTNSDLTYKMSSSMAEKLIVDGQNLPNNNGTTNNKASSSSSNSSASTAATSLTSSAASLWTPANKAGDQPTTLNDTAAPKLNEAEQAPQQALPTKRFAGSVKLPIGNFNSPMSGAGSSTESPSNGLKLDILSQSKLKRPISNASQLNEDSSSPSPPAPAPATSSSASNAATTPTKASAAPFVASQNSSKLQQSKKLSSSSSNENVVDIESEDENGKIIASF
jgi:hypothetical protein